MLKEIKELDTLILSVLDDIALTIIHNVPELAHCHWSAEAEECLQ